MASHFCHFCHTLTPDTFEGRCSKCYSLRVGTHDKRYCAFCGGFTEDDPRGNCAACGAPRYTEPEPPVVEPPVVLDLPAFAPDLSAYDTVDAQGNHMLTCDWKVMRDVDKVPLASIKSSEYVKDPGFDIQWKAAGGIVPRLFWHFFRAGQADQLKLIENTVQDFQSNDLAALDWEYLDPNKSTLDQLNYGYTVLMGMMDHFDTTPYIYTGYYFAKSLGLLDDSRFDKFHFWLAQYPFDTPTYITSTHPKWTPTEMESFKAQIRNETMKPAFTFFGQKPSLWQFTGKCDPKLLAGYPREAVKKVIDFNALFVDVSH